MTVRRSLAWSLSGQIASFAISFAGSVIIARLLSPLEIGVYAVASAIIGIIGVAANVGIGSYLIRERILPKPTIETAFTLNMLISIVLSLSIMLISNFSDLLFGSKELIFVLKALAVLPLIGVFEFLPSTLVQRDMQFRSKSIVLIVSTLLGVGANLFFAILGYSSLSFALSAIIVALFRAVAMNVLVPHHISLRMRLSGWRPIMMFGVRMILISGVAQLAQRLSEVILGSILGLSALGIYSRASNLTNLIFFNLYGSASSVVFSKLSIDYRKTGIVSTTFLRGLQCILAFMWPLMIGMAVLSRPLMFNLYGMKWIDAAVPFSLIMLSQVVVLCFGMNWELFVLKDRTAEQTKLEIVRSLIGLMVFSIGCLFNLTLASVGRIVDSIIGATLYLPRMPQLAGIDASDLYDMYIKNGLLTFVTVLPSVLLMLNFNWSPQTSPVFIIGAVLIGCIMWCITLVWTKHPLSSEIGRFWHERSSV